MDVGRGGSGPGRSLTKADKVQPRYRAMVVSLVARRLFCPVLFGGETPLDRRLESRDSQPDWGGTSG